MKRFPIFALTAILVSALSLPMVSYSQSGKGQGYKQGMGPHHERWHKRHQDCPRYEDCSRWSSKYRGEGRKQRPERWEKMGRPGWGADKEAPAQKRPYYRQQKQWEPRKGDPAYREERRREAEEYRQQRRKEADEFRQELKEKIQSEQE